MNDWMNLLFESVQEKDQLHNGYYLYHKAPSKRKFVLSDPKSVDLKKYVGRYTVTRKLESKWMALLLKIFVGAEVAVSLAKDRTSLVFCDDKSVYDLIPIQTESQKSLFWVKYRKQQKYQRNAHRFVNFEEYEMSDGKKRLFFKYGDSYQYLYWFERKVPQIVFWFTPLLYSLGQIIFSLVKSSFPSQLSIAGTATAGFIAAGQISILVYPLMGKNEVDPVINQTPLWLKIVLGVSQVGTSIGAIGSLVSLATGNGQVAQDLMSIIASVSYMALDLEASAITAVDKPFCFKHSRHLVPVQDKENILKTEILYEPSDYGISELKNSLFLEQSDTELVKVFSSWKETIQKSKMNKKWIMQEWLAATKFWRIKLLRRLHRVWVENASMMAQAHIYRYHSLVDKPMLKIISLFKSRKHQKKIVIVRLVFDQWRQITNDTLQKCNHRVFQVLKHEYKRKVTEKEKQLQLKSNVKIFKKEKYFYFWFDSLKRLQKLRRLAFIKNHRLVSSSICQWRNGLKKQLVKQREIAKLDHLRVKHSFNLWRKRFDKICLYKNNMVKFMSLRKSNLYRQRFARWKLLALKHHSLLIIEKYTILKSTFKKWKQAIVNRKHLQALKRYQRSSISEIFARWRFNAKVTRTIKIMKQKQFYFKWKVGYLKHLLLRQQISKFQKLNVFSRWKQKYRSNHRKSGLKQAFYRWKHVYLVKQLQNKNRRRSLNRLFNTLAEKRKYAAKSDKVTSNEAAPVINELVAHPLPIISNVTDNVEEPSTESKFAAPELAETPINIKEPGVCPLPGMATDTRNLEDSTMEESKFDESYFSETPSKIKPAIINVEFNGLTLPKKVGNLGIQKNQSAKENIGDRTQIIQENWNAAVDDSADTKKHLGSADNVHVEKSLSCELDGHIVELDKRKYFSMLKLKHQEVRLNVKVMDLKKRKHDLRIILHQWKLRIFYKHQTKYLFKKWKSLAIESIKSNLILDLYSAKLLMKYFYWWKRQNLKIKFYLKEIKREKLDHLVSVLLNTRLLFANDGLDFPTKDATTIYESSGEQEVLHVDAVENAQIQEVGDSREEVVQANAAPNSMSSTGANPDQNERMGNAQMDTTAHKTNMTSIADKEVKEREDTEQNRIALLFYRSSLLQHHFAKMKQQFTATVTDLNWALLTHEYRTRMACFLCWKQKLVSIKSDKIKHVIDIFRAKRFFQLWKSETSHQTLVHQAEDFNGQSIAVAFLNKWIANYNKQILSYNKAADYHDTRLKNLIAYWRRELISTHNTSKEIYFLKWLQEYKKKKFVKRRIVLKWFKRVKQFQKWQHLAAKYDTTRMHLKVFKIWKTETQETVVGAKKYRFMIWKHKFKSKINANILKVNHHISLKIKQSLFSTWKLKFRNRMKVIYSKYKLFIVSRQTRFFKLWKKRLGENTSRHYFTLWKLERRLNLGLSVSSKLRLLNHFNIWKYKTELATKEQLKPVFLRKYFTNWKLKVLAKEADQVSHFVLKRFFNRWKQDSSKEYKMLVQRKFFVEWVKQLLWKDNKPVSQLFFARWKKKLAVQLQKKATVEPSSSYQLDKYFGIWKLKTIKKRYFNSWMAKYASKKFDNYRKVLFSELIYEKQLKKMYFYCWKSQSSILNNL
ncbi:hypothetical protein HDV01_000297 [Terramyces sp. JEL0728]|nr:hypothetical protein HDV01_000297 [Terramyces sp. JEL0728]